MDFFFGSSNQQEQPDASHTIDRLCDRVRDASLLEDRRTAVQGLRGLARDWHLQVGTKGLSVLIGILKNDRMDVEIIKLTLETLNILCSKDPSSKDEDLGGMFSEIFVKDTSNIALLLDILAEVEFYVRFATVTLLTTLFESVGDALHEGILTSPLGISRLIDLLDDRREIIRNEGLLFLIKLTSSNTDIQKIVAFENAFERLFAIIIEEDSIEGGIIVQDCLQLMHNLLCRNASNQNLFRETNCIKRVPKLLTSINRGNGKEILITDPSVEWLEQKEQNTLFVLELVRILVEGLNQNTTINQNLLGQSEFTSLLLQTALIGTIPISIRSKVESDCINTKVLLAVGDLINNSDGNREKFEKCILSVSLDAESSGLPNQKPPPGHPTPALLAVVQLMLGKQPYILRSSAAYLFQCYVTDNFKGQLGLTESIIGGTDPLGKAISNGLFDLSQSRKDIHICVYSCKVFASTLFENNTAKDNALAKEFEEHGEKVSFLNRICFSLLNGGNADSKIQSSFLILLTSWMFDHSNSVKEFLSEGSNVQFLVEQVSHSSSDPLLQGLAAFLYGIIYRFNDNSEPSFSQSNLHNLVQSRIGPDIFASRVQRLKETKAYTTNERVILEDGELYFDSSYQEFIRSNLDSICKSVTSAKQKPVPVASSPAPLPVDNVNEKKLKEALEKLKEKELEVVELRGEIKRLEMQVQKLTQEQARQPQETVLNGHHDSNTFELRLEEHMANYKALEADHEDLLMMMNEQDEIIANLKTRLRAHGEEVSDDEDDDEEQYT